MSDRPDPYDTNEQRDERTPQQRRAERLQTWLSHRWWCGTLVWDGKPVAARTLAQLCRHIAAEYEEAPHVR